MSKSKRYVKKEININIVRKKRTKIKFRIELTLRRREFI